MSRTQTIVGIMRALVGMDYEVALYPYASEDMNTDEVAEHLKSFLKDNRIDLVLSNVFTPMVGELTHELEIKYAVYGMDSPMYAAYLPVYPNYDNCYLFYFDKREYQMAVRNGKKNAYYLPLAGDMILAENLIVTEEEISKYSCDMSFVGALYCDNAYDKLIERFPLPTQQFFTEVMSRALLNGTGRTGLRHL